MSKKFKQVSTGLILSCSRKDVIAQYEKYPDLYIPIADKPETAKKSEKESAPKTAEKPTETEKK